MVPHLGVFGKAEIARTGLEDTDVRKHASAAVITAWTFCRAGAAGPLVVVADVVSIEFGCLSARLVAAPG